MTANMVYTSNLLIYFTIGQGLSLMTSKNARSVYSEAQLLLGLDWLILETSTLMCAVLRT